MIHTALDNAITVSIAALSILTIAIIAIGFAAGVLGLAITIIRTVIS